VQTDTCTGCLASETRADTFPIFAVLLNALHKGVAVRILTNDYNTEDCAGKISALPFLALNGAQVRAYATTTFDHQKYMNVDGKRISISSINFSKTSYMYNREAGVVFDGNTAAIAAFTTEVFENDWNEGYAMEPSQTYDSADMDIITDKTEVPVVMPEPFYHEDAYVTPKPAPVALSASDLIHVYAAPDYARSVVLEDVYDTTKSFQLMVYQITDPTLCNEVLEMHKKGIEVTVLVSQCIFATGDSDLALQCYKNLTAAGFTNLYKTPSYYSMSHQKFWIVDGRRVSWSTGNWSPTDFPTSNTYPPYGNAAWQDVNRDFFASIEDADVVSQFQTVLTEDLARGEKFSENPTLTCAW
jgi:phosphatidylserine/phosphatidylglycerophosphate/cardiolipin synthase-like enzyme